MLNELGRYKRMRREDPYAPARVTLDILRSCDEAKAAGFYAFWAESAEVDGVTYRVRVEADDHGFDGDCYGTVEKLGETSWGYPQPVEWPNVVLPSGSDRVHQSSYYSDRETYYEPGPTWEEYAPAGMARGLRRGWMRRQLVEEGLRVRDGWPVGVMVEGPDGESAALWGVDLSPSQDEPADLSYVWEVVKELVANIQWQREERERKAAEKLSDAIDRAVSAATWEMVGA